MNESEYIKATNRVKVTMAITILRDVLPGKNYGISHSEKTEITKRLSMAQEKLFSSYSLEEDSE